MKLFGRDHISLLPFTDCNGKCPYCITANGSLTLNSWCKSANDVRVFLETLPPKAILLSGGEPLLYNWTDFIQTSQHYFYILSNLSFIPKWFRAWPQIKLFIPAYHKTWVPLNRFISNAKTIQDMSIPVMAKIVYTDPEDLINLSKLQEAGIPCSIAPVTGTVNPYLASYSWTTLYRDRFTGVCHKGPHLCRAGTLSSFEIRGTKLYRCSHWYLPLIDNNLGNVNHPRFLKRSRLCLISECACEWHQFSELYGRNDNEQWEDLIASMVQTK